MRKLQKIKRDLFYWPLYLDHGLKHIMDAGFFFDKLDEPLDITDSLKILCTPIGHIKTPKTNKHCVLVTTGSMCPVHDGHIDMMVQAKLKLESEGYEVLGGYLCPDHDNYVSRKNGDQSIPVHVRNKLTTDKINKHGLQSWLSIDPWCGTFAPTDLNFTDVIIRTKQYLHKYCNLNTEICYVFGSDLIKFVNTFENLGLCVAVGRAGYDVTTNIANCYTTSTTVATSSTSVRSSTRSKTTHNKKNVVVRVGYDEDVFNNYNQYYPQVEFIYEEHQIIKFKNLNNNNIISLDSLIYDEYRLAISRQYDIFGHNKVGYYIDNTLTNLPKHSHKSWTLYDDDIYTGQTMRYATSYLKEYGIAVANYTTFNIPNTDVVDVLDNRDLIIFSGNGLVSNVDNIRMPYCYPFVDPSARCSVDNPLQFSIAVWEWNLQLELSQLPVAKAAGLKSSKGTSSNSTR
jgi:hypothetical protein